MILALTVVSLAVQLPHLRAQSSPPCDSTAAPIVILVAIPWITVGGDVDAVGAENVDA